MTKCICGHDKMIHLTERDAGWHLGECDKCNCGNFFSLLGMKRGLNQGMLYSPRTMRLYQECLTKEANS